MNTAEPTGIHGGGADPVAISGVVIDGTDTDTEAEAEREVIDLDLLEDTLEYEALPRPLLGSYLIG